MNQILLYSRNSETAPLHFIRLVNPQFANSSSVSDDWFCGSSEWQWLGLGYAEYAYAGAGDRIAQFFVNPPLADVYYDVSFTISNSTQGGVEVYMGDNSIGTFTGNTAHTALYYSSGSSIAGTISFVPVESGSGIFDGRIDAVSIVQNAAYSDPGSSTDEYEPHGFLDMFEDEPIGITYRVNDLSSIGKRFGAFSKTFRLPGSANNKKLLGHLHTNEAEPRLFDPRNKTKAILLCDNVEAIKGYLSLKNIITTDQETYFEVEIYDNMFGLVDAIKGKKLNELDLSKWSHRLTLDSIRETWTGGTTWNDGYFYPLYPVFGVDYTVNEHFRPAYFHRAILHEIFAQNGFSYSLSDDLLALSDEVLHCPIGKKPNAPTDDLASERIEVESDRDQTWTSAYSFGLQPDYVDWDIYQNRYAGNIEVEDPSSNYDNATYEFVAPYAGTYQIDLDIFATLTLETSYYPVEYYVPRTDTPKFRFVLVDLDNSMVLFESDERQFPSELTSTFSEYRSFVTSGTVDLVAGQRVVLAGRIDNTVVYKTTSEPINLFIRPAASIAIDDSVSSWRLRPAEGTYPVSEGMTVVAEDWLGTISQEQFINDTIKLFNCYMIPDENNERLIHIRTRADLYDTTDDIDRSGAVDMSSDIVKEYLTEISSSSIEFHLKESKDEFNVRYTDLTGKEYGEERYDFATDRFDNSNDVRLSVYSPAPIIRDDQGRFISAILSNSTSNETKLLAKATGATTSDVPIIYYDEQSQSMQVYTHPEYFPCLHTNAIGTGSTYDLNYGRIEKVLTNTDISISDNNLFNRFYYDQFQQYKGRLFTVMMRLSLAEVREHVAKIGSRIFISELNNWFILYSITDFDPQKGERDLTKVQLLEAGPSERSVRFNGGHSVFAASSDLNPVRAGEVSHPSILTESSSSNPTSVFNTNVGNNHVGGQFNNVSGSGNTIGGGTTFVDVSGNNNVVDAGLSGVSIINGSNIHAQTNDTTYIGNTTSISSSGATFFGSSGVTIGPGRTDFYGTGITVSSTGITIGGVDITLSGISVGGSSFENTYVQDGINIYTGGTASRPEINLADDIIINSVDAGILYSGGTDLSTIISSTIAAASGSTFPTGSTGHMLYNSGGTYISREMNIRVANNGTDWFKIGDPSNTVGSLTSSILLAGKNNSSDASASCFILGGEQNILSTTNQSSGVVGGDQNQIYTSSFSVVLGGFSNILFQSYRSSIIGGQYMEVFDSRDSVIVGGSTNLIHDSHHSATLAGRLNESYFNSGSTMIGGEANYMSNSSGSTIIGGVDNRMTGRTGTAIIAGRAITATTDYTLYTNAVDIQQTIDLNPITGSTPSYRVGRMFMSGSTLYLGSGGVFRAVQLV